MRPIYSLSKTGLIYLFRVSLDEENKIWIKIYNKQKHKEDYKKRYRLKSLISLINSDIYNKQRTKEDKRTKEKERETSNKNVKVEKQNKTDWI